MDLGHGSVVEPCLGVVDRVGDEPAVERGTRGVQMDGVVGDARLVRRGCPVDQGEIGMPHDRPLEVFVDGWEVPGVREHLAPRRPRDVLLLHLAKRHPVDVLDARPRQRVDHGVDRSIESSGVPVRVVVPAPDHDMVADDRTVGCQGRDHVPVTQLLDHVGGRADGVHLPVGGKGPRQHAGGAEADRVAEQRDAIRAAPRGRPRRRVEQLPRWPRPVRHPDRGWRGEVIFGCRAHQTYEASWNPPPRDVEQRVGRRL